MSETKVTPLPTEIEIRRWVDTIITPEQADEQAVPLCALILMFANPEDEKTWHLANVAARHAFSKTDAFDEAFHGFTGIGPRFFPETAGIDEEVNSCEPQQKWLQ